MIQFLILLFLDLTITYYYFFLMTKKGCFDYREEKGLVAKYLIKYTKLSPMSFVLHFFISGLYVVALWAFFYHFVSYWRDFQFTIYGVYFIIIWLNSLQIIKCKKNWYNPKFWILYKQLITVRIV